MSLSPADRERYGKIVLDYLDGNYTMDPLDASHVANDVIAQYQQDQAAMERVVKAATSLIDATHCRTRIATIRRLAAEGYTSASHDFVVDRDAIAELVDALDAMEQEATK